MINDGHQLVGSSARFSFAFPFNFSLLSVIVDAFFRIRQNLRHPNDNQNLVTSLFLNIIFCQWCDFMCIYISSWLISTTSCIFEFGIFLFVSVEQRCWRRFYFVFEVILYSPFGMNENNIHRHISDECIDKGDIISCDFDKSLAIDDLRVWVSCVTVHTCRISLFCQHESQSWLWFHQWHACHIRRKTEFKENEW